MRKIFLEAATVFLISVAGLQTSQAQDGITAPTQTLQPGGNANSYQVYDFSALGGVYNFLTSWTSISGPGPLSQGIFGADIETLAGVSVAGLGQFATVAYTSIAEQVTLAPGSYKLVLLAGRTSGIEYSVNNYSASVTPVAIAVPGPEAGAGIGALAMGGIAVWMKGRRKDQALSAQSATRVAMTKRLPCRGPFRLCPAFGTRSVG